MASVRVIADRIDVPTGGIVDQSFEVEKAVCQIGAGQRSGTVTLTGPNHILVVSASVKDYQRIRIYKPDGVIREMLNYQNGFVVHTVGMTGDSIAHGYQTKLDR